MKVFKPNPCYHTNTKYIFFVITMHYIFIEINHVFAKKIYWFLHGIVLSFVILIRIKTKLFQSYLISWQNLLSLRQSLQLNLRQSSQLRLQLNLQLNLPQQFHLVSIKLSKLNTLVICT